MCGRFGTIVGFVTTGYVRASQRVDVGHMIVGFMSGERTVRGNVSRGGVGFWLEARRPPRIEERLLVRLGADAREALLVTAVVRHVGFDEDREAYYVGARFVVEGPDAFVDAALDRYVEERLIGARTGALI